MLKLNSEEVLAAVALSQDSYDICMKFTEIILVY